VSDFKTKLKLAVESARNVAKNAVTGADITVSNDEFERRMSICKGCPKFQPDMSVCGECGCFLNAKARLNGMKCPMSKWDDTVTTISNDSSNNPSDNQ